MPQDPRIDDVLTFWFGTSKDDLKVYEEHSAKWFKKDPAFDQELTERFASLVEHARTADLDDWAATPEGRLALIILLDQYARNIYRGTSAMYASDDKCLRLVEEGLEAGDDKALRFPQRGFFYMPLMHAENAEAQDLCVATFANLVLEAPDALKPRFRNNLGYAIAHRDIVIRFGRFPHRNAILGRESTPEEVEFLKEPGSGF